MLGIGLPEFFVIGVVAMLVFGPDRLPEFAKQAGRMVRQLRTLSRQARDDIRSELGPDYADFELRDLEEVVHGLRLDVREVQEAVDLELGQADLAGELPVEILDVDLLRDGEMLRDIRQGFVSSPRATTHRTDRIERRQGTSGQRGVSGRPR